jgi:2-polyprenyl-6-methoxyphenol 4-hydroxylase
VDSIEELVSENNYDIVIAGGGMVGASLAMQIAASNSSLKILIVESFPVLDKNNNNIGSAANNYSSSFDARSTALSFGSRKIFESMDLWTSIERHVSAIQSIHVSERGRLGSSMMTAEDIQCADLGYVIENAWLGSVLIAALKEKDNVTFCAPAQVAAIKPNFQGVMVDVVENEQCRKITAQLAIIADGANSGLRKKLGIEASVSKYHQAALIANVSFTKPHQGVAYERFTDEGPMALLPLTDSNTGAARAALVWTMDHTKVDHYLQCGEKEFLQQLQKRFGDRQGEFVRVGERFSFPLQLTAAKEQVRSGIVVMGNAAHSLHPVAGQGFNLALRDCACLSELLLGAAENNIPLGQLSLLQKYLERQQYDQQKTMLFSDQLPKLFGRKQWAVSLLRRMGLVLLDTLPEVKQVFIKHAAGLNDGAAGAHSVRKF